MRQLVIDTATEALSVALFDKGALIAHHHEIAGRGHAEKLIPIIAALPEGGHADEIIVDQGPGSFTGLRVGLAAARALGYAWNAPVKAYGCLSLIAVMAQESHIAAGHDFPLAIVLNGGHGELFWQIFDQHSLAPQHAPASTPIAELADVMSMATLYGSGAAALVDARGHGNAMMLHADARAFPLLPDKLLQNDVVPLYGRGADAVPLAQRKGG